MATDISLSAVRHDKASIRRRSHSQLQPHSEHVEELGNSNCSTIKGGDRSLKYTRRHGGLLLGLLVLLSTACIATYFWLQFTWSPAAHSGQSLQAEVNELDHKLDHVLHPEDHVYRKAQTIYHQWRITAGSRRPDGVLKTVYLINDEFLGPTIECRSGDTVVINVENGLEHDGIAMHWHGLHMRGANEMDGAVGFTQLELEPGGNFTYKFRVDDDQHGSFWYHAHDGVQRADGLFGAFIVHNPVPASSFISDKELYGYDEERVLLIGDWYHRSAKDVLAWYMRAASFGNEPVPDSLLLNGLGAYNCSKAVRARPVDCIQGNPPNLSLDATKRYRIRTVNVGDLAGFTISVTGGSMLPIQADGGSDIIGRWTKSMGNLYPGQRVDVVFSGNDNVQNAALEVSLEDENFKYPNPALTDSQSFPIQFHGTKSTGIHVSHLAEDFFDLRTANSPIARNEHPPTKANMTMVLYTTTVKLAHLSNVPHGFINQTSWKPQASPTGHLLSLPRSQWDTNQFVPHIPVVRESAADNASPLWIDLVINNLDDGSHPFHLHGYTVFVLQTHAGFGWGSWNPFEAPEPPGGPLDFEAVVLRDTVYVPKRGYTVVRFKADNPGIWMLHCHILWHQASGMVMGLQIGGS